MRRPSFVLFVTDQQRADHLGCAGNPVLRTPHIDAIAQNGVPLPRSAVTFADVMAAAGYRTALIGKAHLQNMTGRPAAPRPHAVGLAPPPPDLADAVRHDLATGYDAEAAPLWRAEPGRRVPTPFYGFEHAEICSLHGDQVEGDYTAWLRAREPKAERLRGSCNAKPDPRYGVPQAWRTRLPEALYPTAYVAERAEAWLDEAARAEDPFLLVVSFPDPHHPFTPPGRYWDLYDPDQVPSPATFNDKLWEPLPAVPELAEVLAATDPDGYAPVRVTERQAREAIALTYGMIAMIDDAVCRVTAALGRLGLSDRTVLAFTSDHGDYLGDRGVILKFGMHYREVVRVPFLWRDPTGRPGPAVDGRLCGTIDVAPTILARAGLAPPHGVAGRDLFGPAPEPQGMLIEDHAIAYLRSADAASHFVSLVTADARLTRYESTDWGELYDLAADPEERRNLWNDPEGAPLRARLDGLLSRSLIATHDRAITPTGRA